MFKRPTSEDFKKLGEILETPENKNGLSFLETPEEKQLKNIAIALKGILKELEHLNRTLRQ